MSEARETEPQRPLLAVDVDGVISLFDFEELPQGAGVRWELVDGVLHCISLPAGERLRRLAEAYELVWATGWEERANDYLPTLLGLPGELPYLTFDGRARFGSAHWKIDAIADYAGDRPLAWVDDCIDESCRSWAQARPGPTLLVPVDSRHGLEEAQTAALIEWARDGYATRAVPRR
jgi:hypothetical protein